MTAVDQDDPGRIIGSEWADRYPERFSGQALAVDISKRRSCDICSHPTGDCTHNTTEGADMAKARAEAAGDVAPPKTTRRTVTLQGPDELTGVPTGPPVTLPVVPLSPASFVNEPLEPPLAPGVLGLADVPDGAFLEDATLETLTAVRDVLLDFMPRNAQRLSTVLLFPAGTVTSREVVVTRLSLYDVRADVRIYLG